VWPVLLVVAAALIYRGKVQREMVDFGVYRTAATRALSGEPLYRIDDGHYQFKYLPAFAFAMAPFGLVSSEAAKAVWFALSAGLLTALVRWSVRGLPERRRPETWLTWLTVLLMAKFYAHELTLGQTNILLAVLLVAALLAIQIDLPLVAGGLVGLSVFVKPYAIIVLPWIALTTGLGPTLVAAGVMAAGLAAPALVYGWSGNLHLLADWYRTVTASTSPNLTGADNISLAAMWAKWLGPGRLATWLATGSSAAVLGLVPLVWLRRKDVRSPDYLEYALLLLLVPLISPQGWDYVLLLATPAVVAIVDRWRDLTRSWRAFALASLCLMGLTIFDLMGRALYARFMALSIVSVAALGVATTLAHLRVRKLA
jgi:Glycosyltransferase family 87